jgi:metallo-beta-lactamase class B
VPADICIHPWKYFVEPFRIAGNLYYVGNRDVSSHLIDTGEGLILIDTAFPQTVYLLLESIRRLGFNPADLELILHCHAHYDHFGGTRALVELTGAKTALGKEDIAILTERPELSWAPEYGMEFHETFNVDMSLVDGQVIALGALAIECLHIPGHTPGSMSYFFEVKDGGRTFKVGIHGGPGLNTLSAEYLEKYGLPMSRREDYMNSLRRLKEREVDIFIGAHPGQNRTLEKRDLMGKGEQNPFVAPQDWHAFLDGLEENARNLFGIR